MTSARSRHSMNWGWKRVGSRSLMALLTTIAPTLKMLERRSKTFETSRLKPQTQLKTLYGLRFIWVEKVRGVLGHRRLADSVVGALQIVRRLRTSGELTSRVSVLRPRLQFILSLRVL